MVFNILSTGAPILCVVGRSRVGECFSDIRLNGHQMMKESHINGLSNKY